jgi:hypothetical protein
VGRCYFGLKKIIKIIHERVFSIVIVLKIGTNRKICPYIS